MAAATDPELTKLALQTYVYGYPLVYCLSEIGKLPAGTSALKLAAPLNAFAPARDLLGPDAKFVTPNNDTLYLLAGCDVSAGPLRLRVPDTEGRYYVLQFVDAWTNNFAYIGTRATGNGAGEFLLTPPGYSGPVPDGATVVEVPSSIFVIVGRVAVGGTADLPAAHALQDRFDLVALDGGTPTGPPSPSPGVDADLTFWEQLRVALAAFPPPAADAPFVEAAGRLGLLDASSPYVQPDEDLRAVLVAGAAQAEALIESLGPKPVDGWSTAMHAFDYNLDHLGLGTIDTAEWKIADRTTAYATRAAAARLGLWGNHGYEANYEILWNDEHDEPLDGSNRYELTLPSAPPVDAFWSLTMYDKPNYYLVANPIDRYAIGGRTEGVQVGADGSITIFMQHESPGADKESNWLPAPAGGFRPVLREYLPRPAIFSGTYALPKVRRIDGPAA